MLHVDARMIKAPDSVFSRARLCDVDAQEADFQGADFTKAYITGCKFNCSRFTGSGFGYSKLKDDDFRGANLDECKMRAVFAYESAFNGASTRGVYKPEAEFLDCGGSFIHVPENSLE